MACSSKEELRRKSDRGVLEYADEQGAIGSASRRHEDGGLRKRATGHRSSNTPQEGAGMKSRQTYSRNGNAVAIAL